MVDKKNDDSNTADAATPPPPTTAAAAASSSSSSSTAAAITTTTTNPKEEWKSLTPMTTPRSSVGGILTNDHQFLVIGGWDENQKLLSSCEYYDKKTKKWTSLPINLPTGRVDFGVAKVGDRVYVMGGLVGSDDNDYIGEWSLISIDVSGNDLSTLSAANKWETLAPMDRPRRAFACVSHSNFIYVFGGHIEGYMINTAERYDINTNQWEYLPNMPGTRYYSSAGVIGNKIYVVGGNDDDFNVLASTIVFDISTQQWETSTAVPDMKTKRSHLSVVIVDHFVIAIGGSSKSRGSLSTIEVLDTQRNSWNDAPTPMNHGRSSFVAGFLKETNEIIITGDDTTDSISFEQGLLPIFYGMKEQEQDVSGDTEDGPDSLGVATIAEAFKRPPIKEF